MRPDRYLLISLELLAHRNLSANAAVGRAKPPRAQGKRGENLNCSSNSSSIGQRMDPFVDVGLEDDVLGSRLRIGDPNGLLTPLDLAFSELGECRLGSGDQARAGATERTSRLFGGEGGDPP